MPHFSFIYPAALWLLLLLPLLWALSFATYAVSRARLGPFRYWALLAMRSLAILALALALSGIQLVRPVDNLTVVFLIDGSDSVAPAQRQQALQYVNDALASRRPDDEAAVVVFGRNAVVEYAPASLERLSRLTSTVVTSRTDIEEAIQLGLALFPADAQKRLVLLSDGRETEGRAIEAARLATIRDIPIDIVPLIGGAGPDVQISALDAPSTAREEQDVPLLVRIQSSIATDGELQAFVNGELAETRPVQIAPGETDVPITLPSGEAGFYRYEVRLEARGDTQPLNNRAAAFTNIEGPPRVLLVASDPSRAVALENVLATANVRVDISTPDQTPADQTQLKPYTAVILVDVLSRDVPRAVQEALPIYVSEQGGSLAMIGGTESFGAGGWRRSPVAAALPVELDPKDRQERPDLALALVIDRSGSMSESAGGGFTKLDLAREAVYQASLGLESNDQIGVVAFDDLGEWVLPMQRLPGLVEIEAALSMVSDGGGTNIRAGVEPAAQTMPTIDARIKHVILLTDGVAESNYADLIDQMRANDITITVVSIGDDANPALRQIASRGGGEFYRVLSLSDVPRIFLAETVRVARRDIVEEPTQPLVTLNASIVRGIGPLPLLYGYNATERRDAARTILATSDGSPILAQWQYGLGRSVAWTSDLKGQWARDWLTWEQFPRFVGGMLDLLLGPQQSDNLSLEMSVNGAQAVLELTARDAQGQPVENATIQGRLLDPNDQWIELTFEQIGAGRYRAVAPTDVPGAYLTQIAVFDTEGQALGSVSGGLAVSYSPEYRSAQTTGPGATLDELASLTNGRPSPSGEAIFAPTTQSVGTVEEIALPLLWLALLLWPFDIALRRLGAHRGLPFQRQSITASLDWFQRLFQRRARPKPVDETMAHLRRARTRAQKRHGSPYLNDRKPAPAKAPTQQPDGAAPKPAPPPTPPKSHPVSADPANTDEAIATLLARQRARRKKDD